MKFEFRFRRIIQKRKEGSYSNSLISYAMYDNYINVHGLVVERLLIIELDLYIIRFRFERIFKCKPRNPEKREI